VNGNPFLASVDFNPCPECWPSRNNREKDSALRDAPRCADGFHVLDLTALITPEDTA